MNATPSILFIIPYFGRWPFWMPFFVESCRANPDIHWLLVGDCGELADLPPNVRQRAMNFADYCRFISGRLGFEFVPQNPYKLCDLKPAFGFIHEEDVAGYDYWGFSDLDVVYGNLRAYFTPERLNRYKFFSTHERRVSGHLCLMRNERPLRELFLRIPDFRARAQDQKHQGLDEGAFTRLFLWRKNFPEPLFRLVGLFNPWRRAAEFREAFSTPNTSRRWIGGGHDFPDHWRWEDGRLTNSRDGAREFPYLHFLKWKKVAWKDRNHGDQASLRALAATRSWRVDQDGFHPLEAAGGHSGDGSVAVTA